jgi:hypothetical protein
MRGETHHLLDHLTDLAGIASLTWLAACGGSVPLEIIGAVTTIAAGQRYAKAKWGNAYDTNR